jgi:hypothetical protein
MTASSPDPVIADVCVIAERITETVRASRKAAITTEQIIAVLANRLMDPNYLTYTEAKAQSSANEHLATLAMLAAVLLAERAGDA